VHNQIGKDEICFNGEQKRNQGDQMREVTCMYWIGCSVSDLRFGASGSRICVRMDGL
jgi:hypothetical protein